MNVNTLKLRNIFELVSTFVSANPIHAIKENILLDATGPTLVIRAEDEDGGIRVETDIIVSNKNRFLLAVPARILQSTFKQLLDAEVTLVATPEKATLEILSANGRYKISCDDGANFPKFPVHSGEKITASAEALLGALESTLPTVSTDELRFSMNGVRIAEPSKTGSSVIFSTDSHALVRFENEELKGLPVNTTIHRKSALKLVSVLNGRDVVSVSKSEFKIFFEFNGITVYGTTIMDKFPDVTPFFGLPPEPITCRMRRSDLIGSLKRAGVYTQRASPVVKLSLKGQQVNISGQDHDYNKGFSEDFLVDHVGEDLDIVFNLSKLTEIISLIEDEEIVLNFLAENKPLRVRSNNLRIEAILMPNIPK